MVCDRIRSPGTYQVMTLDRIQQFILKQLQWHWWKTLNNPKKFFAYTQTNVSVRTESDRVKKIKANVTPADYASESTSTFSRVCTQIFRPQNRGLNVPGELR